MYIGTAKYMYKHVTSYNTHTTLSLIIIKCTWILNKLTLNKLTLNGFIQYVVDTLPNSYMYTLDSVYMYVCLDVYALYWCTCTTVT